MHEQNLVEKDQEIKSVGFHIDSQFFTAHFSSSARNADCCPSAACYGIGKDLGTDVAQPSRGSSVDDELADDGILKSEGFRDGTGSVKEHEKRLTYRAGYRA